MNLYFRLFLLVLKNAFRKKSLDLFDVCRTRFVVHPFDLDMNMHVNNGRYLTIMDLARTDLLWKAGVLWKIFKGGYYPVVVSESIRFKKSLELFQHFTIQTKIESWDEKDVYLCQHFLVNEEIFAVGYVKARFKQRGRKGSVPTQEMFQFLGKSFDEAKLSGLASAQNEVDSLLVYAKT